MHHQTRDSLRTTAANTLGTARTVLKNQPPMRLGLLAAIGVACLVNVGMHSTALVGHFWASEAPDMVPVLVARSFVPAFQILKEPFVEVKNFPKEFVPPGALHAIAELYSEPGVPAYTTVVSVPEGQPLTRTVLVGLDHDRGLSSLLHLGRVAVSFSIDKSRSAGGWVQPGDTVAVFETIPPDIHHLNGWSKKTHLLFSAVKVLAVNKLHLGQKTDPSEKTDAITELTSIESESNTLTVLVNPAEASALVEARERGPLSIVLRATGDDLPWSALN